MNTEIEEINSRGYNLVREIGQNHKHVYLIVRKNKQDFFAKIDLKDSDGIKPEVWFNQLIETNHLQSIRTPKIIDHSAKWYIAEFIEGELLADGWKYKPTLGKNIELIGQILLNLDQLGQKLKNQTTNNKIKLDNYKNKMLEWSEKPIKSGMLTHDNLEKSLNLIDRYWEKLEFTLQHGDFVPWHIFDDDSVAILIDSEHSGFDKPRFYDLAYCYTRMYTRYQSKNDAAQLLKSFLKQLKNPDVFQKQFIPIMTQRAIGMHFDAVNDQARLDYVKQAQELLDWSLSEKVESFL